MASGQQAFIDESAGLLGCDSQLRCVLQQSKIGTLAIMEEHFQP